MKKLILSGVIAIALLASCDKESELRKGAGTNTALASFSTNVIDFAVEIDTQNFGASQDITVNVSQASNADRTINVNVVDDNTNADPLNYTIPASVTIPAGAYSGTLTITGQDTNLETTPTQIELELVAPDSGTVAGPNATINIFQVCPIPDDYFVGAYTIGDLQGVFQGENFDTGTVDVMLPAPGAVTRTFDASFFGNSQNITINLVCNELVFATTFDSGFVAGTPASAIIIKPASNNTSTYSLTDDTFFSVDYDNEAGGFGTYAGSFFLSKI
ncbi:hypothetical protein [Nonlabens sp.]|uniref:hypothetical protein n=1 Tax=Nonlabens sp. TaxID=1888209 RepID=UPI003F6A4B5F